MCTPHRVDPLASASQSSHTQQQQQRTRISPLCNKTTIEYGKWPYVYGVVFLWLKNNSRHLYSMTANATTVVCFRCSHYSPHDSWWWPLLLLLLLLLSGTTTCRCKKSAVTCRARSCSCANSSGSAAPSPRVRECENMMTYLRSTSRPAYKLTAY